MTRVVLQGALYSFCLPDGGWGAVFPSHIQTSDGRVSLPDEDLLFLVGCRFNGQLFLAGQGHDTGTAWLHDGEHWQNCGLTFGVSPCAFGTGALYVVSAQAEYSWIPLVGGGLPETVTQQIGSQGLRYVNDIGQIITGDATYASPDGQYFQYTDRGSVRVGQGNGLFALLNGRVLETGDCQFIRFEREGDQLAIAIVHLPQHQAVLYWLTTAEIASLPLPGPVVPVPPVHPPEPIPMPGITDSQFATLERVRAKYGDTLNEKEIGALLNEVAWTHRTEGVGMQRKDGGTNATQPTTGIKVWRGMRFAGNIGQDVLGQASIGRCIPTRGFADSADPATFVAPVKPEGVVIIEPPPPPTGDVEARLHALELTVAQMRIALHSV